MNTYISVRDLFLKTWTSFNNNKWVLLMSGVFWVALQKLVLFISAWGGFPLKGTKFKDFFDAVFIIFYMRICFAVIKNKIPCTLSIQDSTVYVIKNFFKTFLNTLNIAIIFAFTIHIIAGFMRGGIFLFDTITKGCHDHLAVVVFFLFQILYLSVLSVISYRTMFFPFCMIDNETNVWKSLCCSWELTREKVLNVMRVFLFGIVIIFCLIIIFGMILATISTFIIAIPYFDMFFLAEMCGLLFVTHLYVAMVDDK